MEVKQHRGQHENCDPCKWQTLCLDPGLPKTHMINGDPWKGNPVIQRIEELTGKEVNTDIPRPTEDW